MSLTLKVNYSKRFNKLIGADFPKIFDNSLKRTIVEADSICQQEAPVDTGTLRRSIGTSHPNMGTVCLTCGVKYWVYNQYGTKYMKANPFVTRTAKKIVNDNLFEANLYDILVSEGLI